MRGRREPPANPTLAERLRDLDAILRRDQRYWMRAGSVRPLVSQFCVTDGDAFDWYVEVDGQGGRARRGVHPTPAVTWRSSLAALEGAFAGAIPEGQEVVITGDPEILVRLFTALGQSRC
ncbi:MAG: hypothetical protein IT384_34160 [Deltaproteobacteria bacterium]|nr:hypothetical protein [Deltaproteobacteria bacterium]